MTNIIIDISGSQPAKFFNELGLLNKIVYQQTKVLIGGGSQFGNDKSIASAAVCAEVINYASYDRHWNINWS